MLRNGTNAAHPHYFLFTFIYIRNKTACKRWGFRRISLRNLGNRAILRREKMDKLFEISGLLCFGGDVASAHSYISRQSFLSFRN